MEDRLEFINFQVLWAVLKRLRNSSILIGPIFRLARKENGQMSPDGVCAINAGPAGHERVVSQT